MSTNEAAAPAVDDDYVVKLPSGDARVMSIDELDAALEAGTIHKDSPVLAPGTVTWTTLGVLAGLDDEPAVSNAAPAFGGSAFGGSVVASPSSVAPMVMGPTDLDDDVDSAVLRPRRRAGKVVVAAFAALAIFAVGFAVKSAVTQTLATRAAAAALAAQPAAAPPPAPAPPPPVVVQAAPPPAPAPSPAAAAPASASTKANANANANANAVTSKAVTAKDKDQKRKNKLPGAPPASKKK
jgi:hypothetical protein